MRSGAVFHPEYSHFFGAEPPVKKIIMIEIWTFLLGLCVGSFLNVCIYRLPGDQTISDPPRSHCPSCDNPIKFYDNIPILSYLWLKGRCRHCSISISMRYPAVELISGIFALCTVATFGLSFEALIYFVFIAVLIVVTFIDIDHQIIPDVISIPGVVVFFLASFAGRHHIGFFKILPDNIAHLTAELPIPMMTYNSILGILIGGGSLYLVAWVYYLLTKKEGMGGGDIKLLAMIGALIGWEGVFFTIFIGSAVGTVAGIAMMIGTRLVDTKLRIPFGPFLSIGAVTYIFFGSRIIYWYVYMAT